MGFIRNIVWNESDSRWDQKGCVLVTTPLSQCLQEVAPMVHLLLRPISRVCDLGRPTC
jgi:hypothetical protein